MSERLIHDEQDRTDVGRDGHWLARRTETIRSNPSPVSYRREEEGDQLLLLVTFLLLAMGIMMMYSSSTMTALRRYDDSAYFLKRQVVWLLLGVAVFYGMSRLPYRVWPKMVPPMVCVGLGLLCLVLYSPLGASSHGATRWLRVGPFSIQPSEMVKVILVIYLACYLYRKGDRIRDFRWGVLPLVVVVGAFLWLILREPDLGTAVVIASVAGGMLFAAGALMRHLVGLVSVGFAACAVVIMQHPYQLQRLKAFLNPWSDPDDTGFQTIQSLLAIGSGGLWGKGLGEGQQKRLFLPEPHTDFIFAVIGEELGLIGAVLALCLFGILVWRGFKIAWEADDLLGYHLATGITLLLAIQIIINVGVTSGVLPTKGLTLPLLSYGGSSLLVNLAAVGILLSISRTRRER